MRSTPCWRLGGICVNFNLCISERYLTEVPGCKDQQNVCCFAWNKLHERDQRIHDLAAPRLLWHNKKPFGVGRGVVEVETTKKHRKRRPMTATTTMNIERTVTIGDHFGNAEYEIINHGNEDKKLDNKTMLRSAAIIILQRRDTDK